MWLPKDLRLYNIFHPCDPVVSLLARDPFCLAEQVRDPQCPESVTATLCSPSVCVPQRMTSECTQWPMAAAPGTVGFLAVQSLLGPLVVVMLQSSLRTSVPVQSQTWYSLPMIISVWLYGDGGLSSEAFAAARGRKKLQAQARVGQDGRGVRTCYCTVCVSVEL